MSAAEDPGFSPTWLGLRERADAAARSSELLDRLLPDLTKADNPVIHDLGCGTGSMGRWLAPQLPGPQRWIMYDRDADLLERTAAGMTKPGLTVETRQRDITRLTAADLAGADLITASALLDMFTADELDRVVAACVEAGCPTLFTISVLGQVEFTPSDPFDPEIEAAFNAHQRRTDGDRTLLGPDAVEATVEAFGRRGVNVLVRPSHWRLGPDQADLIAEWFQGWVDAAVEQRSELAGPAADYAKRRLVDAEAGDLSVVVQHSDLLAGHE